MYVLGFSAQQTQETTYREVHVRVSEQRKQSGVQKQNRQRSEKSKGSYERKKRHYSGSFFLKTNTVKTFWEMGFFSGS